MVNRRCCLPAAVAICPWRNSKAGQLLIDEETDVQLKNRLDLSALDFAKQGNRPDSSALIEAAVNKILNDKSSVPSAKP